MSLKWFAAKWGELEIQLSAPRTLVLSLMTFDYTLTQKNYNSLH